MMRAFLLALALSVPFAAQADIPKGKIKIGVLQDLPDPYAQWSGQGGIVAAQLAAADFETQYLRGDAEILPGISGVTEEEQAGKVRDWLDKEDVAAVVSSAGNAVNQRIAKMLEQHHRTLLIAATEQGVSPTLCSPNVVVWGAGPAARARALTQALLPEDGKSWFVLANQTPAGVAEQAALQQAVRDAGGEIAGSHDHPLGAADLEKQAGDAVKANAQVLALAEGDGDLVSALRQASLSGLSHRMTLVAPFATIQDIDATAINAAQGTLVVAPYYWDTDKHTRRFARRWSERMRHQHVTENAASVYAATLSFLHAAKTVDDIDADKVLPQLRKSPIKDTLFGTASVRQDGRVVYAVGVYQVMQQNQVQQRWAYYRKVKDVPGDKAFPPGACAGH